MAAASVVDPAALMRPRDKFMRGVPGGGTLCYAIAMLPSSTAGLQDMVLMHSNLKLGVVNW